MYRPRTSLYKAFCCIKLAFQRQVHQYTNYDPNITSLKLRHTYIYIHAHTHTQTHTHTHTHTLQVLDKWCEVLSSIEISSEQDGISSAQAAACLEQSKSIWDFVKGICATPPILKFHCLDDARPDFVRIVGTDFQHLCAAFKASAWFCEQKTGKHQERKSLCEKGLDDVSKCIQRSFTIVPKIVDESGQFKMDLKTLDEWSKERLDEKLMMKGEEFARDQICDADVLAQLACFRLSSKLFRAGAVLAKHVAMSPDKKSILTEGSLPLFASLRKDLKLCRERCATLQDLSAAPLWSLPAPGGLNAFCSAAIAQSTALCDAFQANTKALILSHVDVLAKKCPQGWSPFRHEIMSRPELEQEFIDAMARNISGISAAVNDLDSMLSLVRKIQKDGMAFVEPACAKQARTMKDSGVEAMIISWALYEYRTKVQIDKDRDTRNDVIRSIRNTFTTKQVAICSDLELALQKADRDDFVALEAVAIRIPVAAAPPAAAPVEAAAPSSHAPATTCRAPVSKRRRLAGNGAVKKE